nr:methyl-accepting chemotaxis protein [Thiorhodospira sibirica]
MALRDTIQKWSLSAKLQSGGINRSLIALLGLLLISMLVTVLSFVFYTSQTHQNRHQILLASEQRLLSQRIATLALESARGVPDAFVELRDLRNRFDTLLNELATHAPASPRHHVNQALEQVRGHWQVYRASINAIITGQASVTSVADYTLVVRNNMPELFSRSEAVVATLLRTNANREQLYLATRQLMLIQRMEADLGQVLAGGEGVSQAAERFERDLALFVQSLQALLQGSTELGVSRIEDEGVRDRLRETEAIFVGLRQRIRTIADIAPQMSQVNDSVRRIEQLSSELLASTTELERALTVSGRRLDSWMLTGFAFGVLSIVVLLMMGYLLYQDARRSLAETTEQNRRNQRAILRLLDEMTNLAEGDLTVHTTVTEDITGAIADAVNYAIDALRSLVLTINHTAMQVSTAAVKTQATALRLAEASNNQAREIAMASSSVSDMAQSIKQVSSSAEISAEVATKSVTLASKGAMTVHKTIDGMNTIREQIQETSKRIKRLGESSQEIGDIVSLINDIADQTNILALNAAIQASSAGEAGRGFAVVADEVQRLAERSTNATKQIEALVKTIQADTREAVISMERSTSDVVSGTGLALNAGDALAEIESVSRQLAQQIATITEAARQQTLVAQNISATMNVIQEITMQTSDGTNETALSIGNLANLASELRKSVAGFKLPQSAQLETVVLDTISGPRKKP